MLTYPESGRFLVILLLRGNLKPGVEGNGCPWQNSELLFLSRGLKKGHGGAATWTHTLRPHHGPLLEVLEEAGSQGCLQGDSGQKHVEWTIRMSPGSRLRTEPSFLRTFLHPGKPVRSQAHLDIRRLCQRKDILPHMSNHRKGAPPKRMLLQGTGHQSLTQSTSSTRGAKQLVTGLWA